MRSYEEIVQDAKPGRPFGNSTDWEIWQYNVCLGCGNDDRRCVHDDGVDQGDGCPLILVSLSDMTPAEWVGPHGRYRCTAKTTAAEAKRAAREVARTAEKAALETEHYSMFDEGEVQP